jgi:hypothetical protein
MDTEKGIEALSSLTVAAANRETDSHKALSFSDLVVKVRPPKPTRHGEYSMANNEYTPKPIQRICKYPLFFADLCKHTPACDDPVAHADLQKILQRLQNTTEEINYALSNPDVRNRIEISSLLQARFEFDDKVGKNTAQHENFLDGGRLG